MTNTDITAVEKVKDPYYQKEFQKIHDSNESYKGKWNWWAFLFSYVWAINKGCWAIGILMILLTTVLSIFFPQLDIFPLGKSASISIAFPHLIVSLIMGWRGTWFYYLQHVKGKFI